jgi:signal transduction histidine kinase
MPTPETLGHAVMRSLDPRRSLAAGAMWLIIGLAAAFSLAAAVWVGRIARANVSEQHSHDPGAVAEELVRAEELARTGLQEARSAISQMRVNAVRDTGLGPALSREFDRFVDRTGVAGEFSADAESARFADERAETLLRMAQEALRNVERHSMATRVSIKLETRAAQLELKIEDNGVGFDPDAPRPEHYGTVGLREQAELIDAELCIDTAPQLGTKIRVRLRVAPAAFAA